MQSCKVADAVKQTVLLRLQKGCAYLLAIGAWLVGRGALIGAHEVDAVVICTARASAQYSSCVSCVLQVVLRSAACAGMPCSKLLGPRPEQKALS